MAPIEKAYGTDRVNSLSVAGLTKMFLEQPMPFFDGHGSGFSDTVFEIYKNAPQDLRQKIHAATIESIREWTPETSGLQNIEGLAALSSFTENHGAVPELVRIVNEHRITGDDDTSRLAEDKVVGSLWGLIPDSAVVQAFDAWWKEGGRAWMQTRAIFLGLVETDPSRLEELFPTFMVEAAKYETLGDIPLLVDIMTEYVSPDELKKVFRNHQKVHPLNRIVGPALAALEK